MDDLQRLRAQIDAVDDRLTQAYLERLELVFRVAEYKRAHGVGVEHTGREEAVLRRLTEKFGTEHQDAIGYLYANIISYSKVCQRQQLEEPSEFSRGISGGCAVPPCGFADCAVACQGVAGAYSGIAAQMLVRNPRIEYFPAWEDVFRAVSDGSVPFGVLPIENSTAGSVNEVYDLLVRYRLHICGGKKVHIRHCLLGTQDASPDGVRTVLSHPQALYQCRAYLAAHGLSAREVSNTAVAAETVSRQGDATQCAVASPETAGLYGLKVLASNIQDAERNDTRFILISRRQYADPQANKVSLVVSIPHRKGSLFQLLGIVDAYGVNIAKLESRPIPERNFEFLFYFDLEGSVAEPRMQRLLENIRAYCATTEFLGSYRED